MLAHVTSAANPVKTPNVHPDCWNVPGLSDEGLEELCHLVVLADPSGEHRVLERDGRGHPLGQCAALLGTGADQSQALGQPGAPGSLRLEQRPKGKQVVTQGVKRAAPLASHFKPGQRPGEFGGAEGPVGQRR